MAISRPSVLSDEDRDAIIEAMRHHGAKMTVQDPRLTQLQTWVLAAVGTGVLGLGAALVTKVNTLNETMVRYITVQEYSSRSLESHMLELNDHEIRLTRIEATKK